MRKQERRRRRLTGFNSLEADVFSEERKVVSQSIGVGMNRILLITLRDVYGSDVVVANNKVINKYATFPDISIFYLWLD